MGRCHRNDRSLQWLESVLLLSPLDYYNCLVVHSGQSHEHWSTFLAAGMFRFGFKTLESLLHMYFHHAIL